LISSEDRNFDQITDYIKWTLVFAQMDLLLSGLHSLLAVLDNHPQLQLFSLANNFHSETIQKRITLTIVVKVYNHSVYASINLACKEFENLA